MSMQVRRPPDQLVGSFRDPSAINAKLQLAAETMNLVTPSTSVGQLPEGCDIAISAVMVDVKTDCYSVGGGKFGLFKTALQRIANGLGVSWDPVLSGRLDDGSHPHFCHWRAVGTYKAFDGQIQRLCAEKVLDLRHGSPQLEGKSDFQLREMRAHIASHAETKCQLRAIRSLGIKTAYTAEELSRPFVAARIFFSGRTEDPQLRREFARMTAESFLGAHRALYGDRPTHIQSGPTMPSLAAPPPVGQTPYDPDEVETTADPATQPPPAPSAQPAESRQQSLPAGNAQAFTIPGGKEKGVPIEKASDSSLMYWADRLGKNLDVPKDIERAQAMRAELDKRNGAGDPADGGMY